VEGSVNSRVRVWGCQGDFSLSDIDEVGGGSATSGGQRGSGGATSAVGGRRVEPEEGERGGWGVGGGATWQRWGGTVWRDGEEDR
jgi:hypothetical protein